MGKLKIASLSCQRVILPKIIMKNKLDVDTNDKTSIELGYMAIGNCAEQVAVNNTRYFRQKTGEKLFAKKSEIKVQAFAPAKGVKGVYNVPVKPCGSCQPVLKEFGISHGATQALPLKCDRMAQMIASGLTVGCKACQHCQEKKE